METCQHCGKEFENSKALGSHIHYAHGVKITIKLDLDSIREKVIHVCYQDRSLTISQYLNSFIKAGAEAMAKAIIDGILEYFQSENVKLKVKVTSRKIKQD